MTKVAALKTFLGSFGYTTYPNNMVPKDAEFPYLTYETGFGKYGTGYPIVVHLHFWSESESVPNAAAEEMTKALSDFVDLECDGGMISLISGNPKWYAARDEAEKFHKHRIINVEVWDFTT